MNKNFEVAKIFGIIIGFLGVFFGFIFNNSTGRSLLPEELRLVYISIGLITHLFMFSTWMFCRTIYLGYYFGNKKIVSKGETLIMTLIIFTAYVIQICML